MLETYCHLLSVAQDRQSEKDRKFWKILLQRTDLPVHETSLVGKKSQEYKDCSKIMQKKSHLSDKLKTHSGGNPYECQDCKKTFKWNSSLLLHLTSHTGAENYKYLEHFHQKSIRVVPPKSHPRDNLFEEYPQIIQPYLQDKLQTHSLERLYKRLKCPKTQSQVKSYNTYKNSHRRETP